MKGQKRIFINVFKWVSMWLQSELLLTLLILSSCCDPLHTRHVLTGYQYTHLVSLVSVDGCCGSSLNADIWLAAAAGQTSVSRETKLFILCLFKFYWQLEFLHISKLTLHRVSCIFSVVCNLKLRLHLSQRWEVFTWQSWVTPEEHIHHRSSCPLFIIHRFWPEFPISHGGQRLDPLSAAQRWGLRRSATSSEMISSRTAGCPEVKWIRGNDEF